MTPFFLILYELCDSTDSMGMTDFRNWPSVQKNPIFDLDQDNLRSTKYQYSNPYSYDWDLPETKMVEGRPHRVTKDDKGDEVGDQCVLLESCCVFMTLKLTSVYISSSVFMAFVSL